MLLSSRSQSDEWLLRVASPSVALDPKGGRFDAARGGLSPTAKGRDHAPFAVAAVVCDDCACRRVGGRARAGADEAAFIMVAVGPAVRTGGGRPSGRDLTRWRSAQGTLPANATDPVPPRALPCSPASTDGLRERDGEDPVRGCQGDHEMWVDCPRAALASVPARRGPPSHERRLRASERPAPHRSARSMRRG
jgi:hypothetical protein